MSTIHSSCAPVGRRSALKAGSARFSTVRSMAYTTHGRASTAKPSHWRRPTREDATVDIGLPPELSLPLLQNGQHVAGRVLEPCDVRTVGAEHALVVLLQATEALQPHAPGGERLDGLVDVVHLEVQHGVTRRRRVRLLVDQRVPATSQTQPQQAVLLARTHTQRLGVETASLQQVGHSNTAIGLGVGEHSWIPSIVKTIDDR